ncbi:hypothetical protein NU08_1306 [Flavobacterium anhuiense]|uniref:Uncharacterized protein n=1 Tax=Flavobacterium anhuiense TaxID=459526 RepID=A0A444W183_9FLAO|nr:hypothetical protein NU08_1306 [Flavobacterium anhuiense]
MLQKPIPFEFISFPAIIIDNYVQIELLDLGKASFFIIFPNKKINH